MATATTSPAPTNNNSNALQITNNFQQQQAVGKNPSQVELGNFHWASTQNFQQQQPLSQSQMMQDVVPAVELGNNNNIYSDPLQEGSAAEHSSGSSRDSNSGSEKDNKDIIELAPPEKLKRLEGRFSNPQISSPQQQQPQQQPQQLIQQQQQQQQQQPPLPQQPLTQNSAATMAAMAAAISNPSINNNLLQLHSIQQQIQFLQQYAQQQNNPFAFSGLPFQQNNNATKPGQQLMNSPIAAKPQQQLTSTGQLVVQATAGQNQPQQQQQFLPLQQFGVGQLQQQAMQLPQQHQAQQQQQPFGSIAGKNQKMAPPPSPSFNDDDYASDEIEDDV